MNGWKAQVKVAPAAGYAQVLRQGEPTNRRVAVGRHVAGVLVNEWVLVVDVDGQLYAIAILGTGPGTVPDNPDPTPPAGPPTLLVPVAWAGDRWFKPYNGSTPDGFDAENYGVFFFGRHLEPLYYYNERSEGLAVYSGLAGLDIVSAKVTFTGSTDWTTEQAVSGSTRLVLWLAPATQPADRNTSHPTMSIVLDQALGFNWPPAAPTEVTLPATWITHLKNGTANGIGLINNTMPPADGFGAYIANISSMTVQYN